MMQHSAIFTNTSLKVALLRDNKLRFITVQCTVSSLFSYLFENNILQEVTNQYHNGKI